MQKSIVIIIFITRIGKVWTIIILEIIAIKDWTAKLKSKVALTLPKISCCTARNIIFAGWIIENQWVFMIG